MNSEPELTQEDWTNYIQNSENNDVQYSYTTSSNPNYPIFLGKFVKIKEVPTDTQSKQDTAGQYYYGNNLKTYEFENKNLVYTDFNTLKIATNEQIEKFNRSKGKTLKEIAAEGRAAIEAAAVSEQLLLTNAKQYLNDVYKKKTTTDKFKAGDEYHFLDKTSPRGYIKTICDTIDKTVNTCNYTDSKGKQQNAQDVWLDKKNPLKPASMSKFANYNNTKPGPQTGPQPKGGRKTNRRKTNRRKTNRRKTNRRKTNKK